MQFQKDSEHEFLNTGLKNSIIVLKNYQKQLDEFQKK